MTMPAATISKLVFCPVEPQAVAPCKRLKSALSARGWLGTPYPAGPAESFFTGERFFQFVTFMGCAPALRLQPDHDGDLNFCFIRLWPGLSTPIYRGHQQRFVPRCPVCRQGIADWQQYLLAWQENATATFVCPHCSSDMTIPRLNWREKAGVARSFIDVYSVYPHEGTPTPQLLDCLQDSSDMAWKYFYDPG